ncbi:MAG: hypothetical protein ACI841_000630 [Planctomycetota bacterium]|jgi:hypothetical protein
MARPTPQSFEKRQRERRKQEKRAEKLERRLIRSEEKRRSKEEGYVPGELSDEEYRYNEWEEGDATAEAEAEA